MGNSPKRTAAHASNSRFCDESLYKVVLKGHFSKIFGIDIYHLEESNTILIASVSKDGNILIYSFKDQEINTLSAKKKSKTVTKSKKYRIPLRSSYVMTTSLTNCKALNSTLVANGGLDNLCIIHKLDLQNSTDSRLHEISLSEGYTANIRLMNDNSNRVIFGSGDSNVYIYNYVETVKLLTIQKCSGDVTFVDYFIDGLLDLLIIGISCIDGNVYVVTINDKDHSNMQIINIQSINTSKTDVNCIAFSPNNHEFIACGGDDGICAVLIKNDVGKHQENILKYEYDILFKKELNGNHSCQGITSCCWIDSKTVVFGGDESGHKLDVLKLIVMKNNKECIEIIAQFLGKIESLAKLVLDYCGYYTDKHSIQTPFEHNTRVTQVRALPNYATAPGIFCACSWDNTCCLFIPMRKI